MMARYSAFLTRRRRPVLVAAVAVALLLTAVSTVVPGLGLIVLGVVVALTLLGLASREPRTDDFVLVDGGFATARSSVPVTWALAGLGLAAVVFAEGVRDEATPWAPWLTLLAAYVLPLVVCHYGVWRGIGITLTPDGLRADKLTGAVFVPWDALSADQFAPPPNDDGQLIVRYAHPEQVRRFGFPIDLDRASFTHTSSAFAAAAIQHYVTHPEQRPSIGTPSALAALSTPADQPVPADRPALGDLPVPADPPALGDRPALGALPGVPEPARTSAERPLPPPPSRRRRARTALAGAALLVVATALLLWTAATLDLPGAEQPLELAVLAGLAMLVSAAFPGITRPAPPATPPPSPSRAPWARDVTQD
jgi:hypothetical protein